MLGGVKYSNMALQEGVRLNSFVTAKTFGGGDLSLRDFGEFAWEDREEADEEKMTPEELRERMDYLMAQIQ